MPRAKKVLAATAGVAAAAGLALAARRKGRRDDGESDAGDARGEAGGPRTYRVVPAGDDWEVALEGSSRPASRYGTKREAVDAARAAAHAAAPSALVIHRADGTIQRRHAYGAG